MDQVHVIRHQVLVEGASIRQVAKRMGVARNTVRRYLGEIVPGERRAVDRKKPVTDGVRPRLRALLEEAPRWTGGKQRLTSVRLHQMLAAEGHKISERMVRAEMAEWKRQRQEVFVPLVYRPGELAEVDFFEVVVDVGGRRQKAWMFLLRMMYSGRDFAWLYPRQDQVAFLDGHVRAFSHLGAVPHRIVYDNLKAAVAHVLVGAERELAPRFLAMCTHYVLEASFARPRTGHDKGGVEARGKGVRWQHLVPIPSGPNLASISEQLQARLDARARETIRADGRTVADLFAEELPGMLPAPVTPFRAAAPDVAVVSRRSLIKVGGASYSVWSDWAGLTVTTRLGVDDVEIVGRDGRKVHHPRQPRGGRSIDYRHYLPELASKPQAVRQVAAELVRDLGEPFPALWRELVDEDGPRYAGRVFAKVLDAIVEFGVRFVVERVIAARAGGVPVLLALRPQPPPAELDAVDVPALLQNIEVISSDISCYDALLGGAA